MIIMFDTISNTSYPDDAAAYAAYVDGGLGDQPNYAAVRLMFPAADVLSIALHPADYADCLDMENDAAAYADFPAWWKRQRARGVARPCGYASASPMASELLPIISAAGIPRASVRLWAAHTGQGAHLCGPAPSCGVVPVEVDGTQWTFNALGRNLDQSQLLDDFFGAASPVPPWQEAMMQQLPVIQQGSLGDAVRTVQGLCNARLSTVPLVVPLAIDGVFGPDTKLAVVRVQDIAVIKADGIVGPQTWPALLGV